MEEITKAKQMKREKESWNSIIIYYYSKKTHSENITHKKSQVSWADVQVETNSRKATNSMYNIFLSQD